MPPKRLAPTDKYFGIDMDNKVEWNDNARHILLDILRARGIESV